MYIECHLNIKNVVLRNVLTTYISKTPFLRASQELITDIENLALYKGDLIIIEFNNVYKDLIDDLISSLSNKFFIILMDLRLPYFKKRPLDNVIYLSENLTHSEFVEALSELIDHTKTCWKQ